MMGNWISYTTGIVEYSNNLECSERKKHIKGDGKAHASKLSTLGDNDEAPTPTHQGFELIA